MKDMMNNKGYINLIKVVKKKLLNKCNWWKIQFKKIKKKWLNNRIKK